MCQLSDRVAYFPKLKNSSSKFSPTLDCHLIYLVSTSNCLDLSHPQSPEKNDRKLVYKHITVSETKDSDEKEEGVVCSSSTNSQDVKKQLTLFIQSHDWCCLQYKILASGCFRILCGCTPHFVSSSSLEEESPLTPQLQAQYSTMIPVQVRRKLFKLCHHSCLDCVIITTRKTQSYEKV